MKRLIVCSTLEEYERIPIEKNSNDMIIAGNRALYEYFDKKGMDVRIFEDVEKKKTKIIWNIIEYINQYVKDNLSDSFLYEISYHIEGGVSLSIANYISILNDINKLYCLEGFTQIIVIDNVENWKYNEVLYVFAKEKEIEYLIFDDISFEKKEYLYTLRNTKYAADYMVRRERELLVLQEAILNKYRSVNKQTTDEECKMAFLYAAYNDKKHLSWFLARMNPFRTISPTAICLYRCEDGNEIERMGFRVEYLQDYFDKESFRVEFNKYVEDRKKLLICLENKMEVIYEDVDITELVLKVLYRYFYQVAVEIACMNNCAKKYFRTKHYKIIYAWGNSNFWENRICYINTQKDNTKYMVMNSNTPFYEKIYEPYGDIIPIRLFPSNEVENEIIFKEYKRKSYYTFDLYYAEKFYKSIYKNIQKKEERILLALSGAFPGIYSTSYYVDMCMKIISDLKIYGKDIILKNHPETDPYVEKVLKNKYGDCNYVQLINKNEQIEEILKKSEIVITDVSTVIFDAITNNSIVICAVFLEHEYEMIKHLQDGVLICKNLQELNNTIKTILCDISYKDKVRERQKKFFEKLFGRYSSQNITEVVAIVEANIE